MWQFGQWKPQLFPRFDENIPFRCIAGILGRNLATFQIDSSEKFSLFIFLRFYLSLMLCAKRNSVVRYFHYVSSIDRESPNSLNHLPRRSIDTDYFHRERYVINIWRTVRKYHFWKSTNYALIIYVRLELSMILLSTYFFRCSYLRL